MINIAKRQEPDSLKDYREKIIKQHGTVQKKYFENIPQNVKEDVQKSLFDEQNSLCCYCMKTINIETIVIEHFKPKDDNKYGHLALSYENLLGSCEGCTGKLSNSHCDKNKKNIELKKIPNPAHNGMSLNQFIDYSVDGEVKLKDAYLLTLNEEDKIQYLYDINRILNLNEYELRKARSDKWLKMINIFTNNSNSKSKTPSALLKPNIAFRGYLQAMIIKKFGAII